MPALTTPIEITTAQSGTTSYGPWAVAAGQKGVKVRFLRDSWPGGLVLTARLALRGTNQRGQVETWSNTWSLQGGDAIGREGVQSHTEIGWEWPGEAKLDPQLNFELDESGRRKRHAVPIDQIELSIRIFQAINTTVDVESF